MKKFELTTDIKMHFGHKLFRIKALVSFGSVAKGELGGYIEQEDNLSQDGNAWVSGDAWVFGNARVSGNARVFGDAQVFGDADWCVMTGFGSGYRTTTAFRQEDGSIRIQCGCYNGLLDEFEERVRSVHGDNVHGRAYLKMIEMLRIRFGVEEVNA